VNAVESSSIVRQVLDWAAHTGIAANDEEGRRLVTMGVAAWPAYALPRCASEERVLAAQWATFICVLDDQLDRASHSLNPDAVKLLMNGLLDVLTATPRQPRSCPLQHALSDLWQRTAANAPEEWCRRFVIDYSDFAAASWEEACLREAGTELDLTTYLQLRRRSITMLPLLDIAEHLCGVRLSDQWHEHEAIRALKWSAIEAVSCANDIASAQNEVAKGHHNVVRIIAREDSSSTSDAYKRVDKMVNTQCRRFDHTMSYFAKPYSPLSDIAGFPTARVYAVMLRDLLYGTLRWISESARYEPAGGRNIRKRNP
jgi:hypothetical protein